MWIMWFVLKVYFLTFKFLYNLVLLCIYQQLIGLQKGFPAMFVIVPAISFYIVQLQAANHELLLPHI